MLNRRVRMTLVILAVSLGIMSFTSGCGLLKKDKTTEPETQSEIMTEQTETETETETEPQTEVKKDIAYTSTDKTIRITLPDSTWTVTQDVDEMRVFSSGTDAMINIVHAANASDMRNISVASSEQALRESLTRQYPEANSFEIMGFEQLSSAAINTYEYVVKYNSTSMWAYSITYGILAEDQAYVITGTVTDDNRVLMEAVKKAVESFTVLRNNAFTAMPGTVVNNNQSESQVQSETESGDTAADAELKNLTDYGTTAQLYANDVVNIRLTPSTESSENIIGSLNAGDQVTVIGETPQWFKVNILGNIGYINKAFLVKNPPTTEAAQEKEEDTAVQSQVSVSTVTNAELNSYVDYGTSYTLYASSEVNLRAQPGTDSTVVGGLYTGQSVSVIGETDNWFMVSVDGMTGYVSKSYITSDNSSVSSNGSTGGNTENDGSGTTSSTGVLSGTVTGATGDTVTIQGDDGNIYYINYSDASLSTNDGLVEGAYITAAIDYSNTAPNGTLYATSVSGH